MSCERNWQPSRFYGEADNYARIHAGFEGRYFVAAIFALLVLPARSIHNQLNSRVLRKFGV